MSDVSRPDLAAFSAFFRNDLENEAGEIAASGRMSAQSLGTAAQLGALSLTAPAEVGGHGLGLVETLPYLEAAAQGPAAGRMLVHVANGLWRPILKYGSAAQRELVSAAVRGETILALAVTEPAGGSGKDLGSTARRDGDGRWRLSGEKHLITWAQHADWFIVLAGVETGDSTGQLTTFLVPRSAAGVDVEPQQLMGLDGIGLGRVKLSDVVVGEADLLGDIGSGMKVLGTFLDYSRISLSACMVGVGQRALDETVGFAKERTTFGKPLAERQAIQTQLASMYAKVAASRAFVASLARAFDEGSVDPVLSAAAKLFCADAVNDVTDIALRLHGGLGYTTARPIERIYRDARAFWFEEGTAEIQQLLIARRLLR